MPLIAWVDQPLLVQCTRYLWSLDWGDIPFSGLSVSVCGGRKGAAPDSQAATIPEGAWFSLIPGPASGAPGGGGVSVRASSWEWLFLPPGPQDRTVFTLGTGILIPE